MNWWQIVLTVLGCLAAWTLLALPFGMALGRRLRRMNH